jgi:hypothetical protein
MSLPVLDIGTTLQSHPVEETRTPSLFSAKLSASSKGSLQSGGSHRSGTSYRSSASRGSRQGRRKHPYESHKKLERRAVFACVFCKITCKTLWEWKRHEQSAHVAPIEYICENLPMLFFDNKCVYCGAGEDWWDINDHRVHVVEYHQLCARKVFSRLDHLVQHIRLVHKAPKFSIDGKDRPRGNGWSERKRHLDALDDALFCGFCAYRSEDWDGRVAHVTAHFKAGQDVSDWDWERETKPPCEPFDFYLVN